MVEPQRRDTTDAVYEDLTILYDTISRDFYMMNQGLKSNQHTEITKI